MNPTHQKFHSGFTLIEMIVSLGVFGIIVTTAIGALLVLVSSNQKLQGEQSVMTNLAFALDGMTREIRTGYFYFCDGVNNQNAAVGATGGLKIFDDSRADHEALGTQTRDCTARPSAARYYGISFIEGGSSVTSATANRIMYYVASTTTEKKLMRRVGNQPAQSIVAEGLEIVDIDFTVTGSAPQKSGNNVQPTVTLFLAAKEIGQDKLYTLETTITQRTLDI
jgi:prepilin-type N-terminal cleavage/methylation domain-containing protein